MLVEQRVTAPATKTPSSKTARPPGSLSEILRTSRSRFLARRSRAWLPMMCRMAVASAKKSSGAECQGHAAGIHLVALQRDTYEAGLRSATTPTTP